MSEILKVLISLEFPSPLHLSLIFMTNVANTEPLQMEGNGELKELYLPPALIRFLIGFSYLLSFYRLVRTLMW